MAEVTALAPVFVVMCCFASARLGCVATVPLALGLSVCDGPRAERWSASVPPPGHPPYPGPAAVILEVNNSLERSQAERRPTWTVIDNDARPQCRPTFAFLQLLILLVIIMIMSFRLAFYYH